MTARTTDAAQPVRSTVEVEADIALRMARLSALREEAQAAAAQDAAKQAHRNTLLVEGANAHELGTVHRDLAAMREALEGYDAARIQIEHELRPLRREHARVHVTEVVAETLRKADTVDAAIRQCANVMRPLLTGLEASIAEAQIAERQARDASNSGVSGRALSALAAAGGGHLDALREAAVTVVHYTETHPGAGARSRPRTAVSAADPPAPPA